MNTQRVNGNGATIGPKDGTVQVNPIEAAQMALMFLSRAEFKRHERQSFDLAEAMLNAIAQGQVVLTTPPPQQEQQQASEAQAMPEPSPPLQ